MNKMNKVNNVNRLFINVSTTINERLVKIPYVFDDILDTFKDILVEKSLPSVKISKLMQEVINAVESVLHVHKINDDIKSGIIISLTKYLITKVMKPNEEYIRFMELYDDMAETQLDIMSSTNSLSST